MCRAIRRGKRGCSCFPPSCDRWAVGVVHDSEARPVAARIRSASRQVRHSTSMSSSRSTAVAARADGHGAVALEQDGRRRAVGRSGSGGRRDAAGQLGAARHPRRQVRQAWQQAAPSRAGPPARGPRRRGSAPARPAGGRGPSRRGPAGPRGRRGGLPGPSSGRTGRARGPHARRGRPGRRPGRPAASSSLRRPAGRDEQALRVEADRQVAFAGRDQARWPRAAARPAITRSLASAIGSTPASYACAVLDHDRRGPVLVQRPRAVLSPSTLPA